jgi:uncharacterized membrane protein
MSYQIGGYTTLLPRSSVVPLDLPVETAMRMVLTGGTATIIIIKKIGYSSIIQVQRMPCIFITTIMQEETV